MMLADSNVWLALTLAKHEFHSTVRAWIARQRASAPVLFCRSTQQSLLRLLTTDAVMSLYAIPPLSNRVAWATYERLLTDKRIAWANEPGGVDTHWKKLSAGAQASPKLWMDAYLAAFAIAGGYRLVTTDKAFNQFKGLDLVLLSKA